MMKFKPNKFQKNYYIVRRVPPIEYLFPCINYMPFSKILESAILVQFKFESLLRGRLPRRPFC